jgi:hypothetical protein
MNKITQFWGLVKFQVAINPFVIVVPVAMLAPYYIVSFTIPLHDYHPSLDSLLFNQNLYFVGIIGFLLLAPEVMRSATSGAAWPTGTEFILTRAVDRHLVLRARSAFFYLLVLVIPVFALVAALRHPDVQVNEYDKVLHREVLDRIPGSIPAPPDREGRSSSVINSTVIMIPNGNALVESWRSWEFLSLAIGVQVFLFLIYRLRYRRFIVWGTYLAFVFVPLVGIVNRGYNIVLRGYKSGSPSLSVSMFFAFVAHQWLFWPMTIGALILGQVWCERRFASLEH